MKKRTIILSIAVLALAGVMTAIAALNSTRRVPADSSSSNSADSYLAALGEESSRSQLSDSDSTGFSGESETTGASQGASNSDAQGRAVQAPSQDASWGASVHSSQASGSLTQETRPDKSPGSSGASRPQTQPSSSSQPAASSKPQAPSAPQAPSSSEAAPPSSSKPGTSDNVGMSNASYLQQVVDLVNQERAKAGLDKLSVSHPAQRAAQIRAKEIQTSFSHTRPNGSSPFTALEEQNISYRSAGENIAWGQKTPEQVMQGWMNSDGHRANILSKNFTAIGVGYYLSESGVPYWTQLFIG